MVAANRCCGGVACARAPPLHRSILHLGPVDVSFYCSNLSVFPSLLWVWGLFELVLALCRSSCAPRCSLYRVNAVSSDQMSDAYSGGCLGPAGIRIWLLFGLIMSFGSLIASGWLMGSAYIEKDDAENYPGVALFLQSLLIFLSSMLFKFGRAEA